MRGFFASRCKAEGGGKKPRGDVAPGRARRSRPRLDQANREAARRSHAEENAMADRTTNEIAAAALRASVTGFSTTSACDLDRPTYPAP